jgi:hypothetical protein
MNSSERQMWGANPFLSKNYGYSNIENDKPGMWSLFTDSVYTMFLPFSILFGSCGYVE